MTEAVGEVIPNAAPLLPVAAIQVPVLFVHDEAVIAAFSGDGVPVYGFAVTAPVPNCCKYNCAFTTGESKRASKMKALRKLILKALFFNIMEGDLRLF